MTVKYSSYSMMKRLLALFVLVTFFVVIIIFRMFYLQIAKSRFFVSEGLTEWLRDLPLIATRGSITDRNGVVLASSYTTYDVYVRPADIKNAESVAQVLSNVLNLDFEDVLKKITNKGLSEIRIKNDIEKSDVQSILKDYQSGIFFTTDTERNYTYDSMLCQILGFVGSDNTGQTGLEAFYNSYLKGIDGVSLVESDLKGTTLEDSMIIYENAISGLNLTLTIDFRIQEKVEEILTSAMASTGAKSISCLITNPQTGEILSVATLPSYNLNDIPRDDMQSLNNLSRATTIVDTFEPGSTFKPIIAAIALEEGLTSKNHYYYCGGYRIINGVKIKCARRSGHGSQTLEQGLMNSCNCVFMDIIQQIGLDKFYDYLEKFGFTGKLGLDFPGEVSAVLMPKTSVTLPDLARMGFGQTIALSSLEMVSGIGTVINNGFVLEPQLLKSISTESGKVIYTKERVVKNKILSDSTSRSMREMLLKVVEKGGGKYAKIDGYAQLAGKTGTAQKYENGKIAEGKYIATFAGFAPYDDPKYLIYVVVDEPQGAYYGGIVSAPIAKNIFQEILKIEERDVEYVDDSNKKIELPTFIGMTLTEAVTKIGELRLQYLIQGDGDRVTGQIASPGTMVAENDIVLLIFD